MAFESARVLLVDDDTRGLAQLGGILEAQPAPSFVVDYATSPATAEPLLRSFRPDIVLFNLSARDGGLSGLALLQVISNVPVIALAPTDQEALALKAVMQGADEYLLTDQIYDTLLVRSIRHALERRRADDRRRVAERAQRISERRYRALFEQSRDALYITDSLGAIIEINAATVLLLGHGMDELYGRTLATLFADADEYDRTQRQIREHGYARELEVRLRRKDGELLWCLLSAAERLDDDAEVRGYQGIIHDITDRKRAEERLLHNAFHDALTGLPNRALFTDRLNVALARWRRDRAEGCAVLFLDLDRFKVVNDSLGHSVGDALLMRVAGALASCLRAHETVARLGGDEFAVLLEQVTSIDDAVSATQRIQERLAAAFELQDQSMFTSASIGIALPDDDEQSADDLLRNADIAMYRAKAAGPGRYEVFAAGMHTVAINLLEIETDLRHALGRNEFVLYYQPIVSLPDQRVVGFEALLRWNHPRRGLLLPHDFIGIAEETGLMVPIGWWALREACAHGRALLDHMPARTCPYVAVNLSSRQLSNPSLAERVLEILGETGLPGALLSLEITESSLVTNVSGVVDGLVKLRSAGVRICIDDFGTGYSSLSYLNTLPVDGLKIDRSFVSMLGSSGDRSELVRTIIALASRLGISTVAEGVETSAQLQHLQRLGSVSMQGFLFSQPMEAAAARALLDIGTNSGRPGQKRFATDA
jgi:diguanylate cyclase (GGDEF)-like protein/PAS domain S-box-containing protein